MTDKKNTESILDCPLHAAINVVGGKWKTIILYMLADQTLRFGELKKTIPKITQKMLTQQLRELESDGLVTRVVYPEIPPKVEYSLTDLAKDLRPILAQLCTWGSRLK
jgi:DNA-binding HxlR family transcriptional regulator